MLHKQYITKETANNKSAYMLVYERKVKVPPEIVVPAKTETLNIVPDDKLVSVLDHGRDIKVPEALYKEIVTDNTQFVFDKAISNSDFFQFLQGVGALVSTKFPVSEIIMFLSNSASNKYLLFRMICSLARSTTLPPRVLMIV